MHCNDSRILMHGYLDNELEPAEATALGEHLAACGECRCLYDRQRVLSAAVKKHAAERFQVPEALPARILAALPAEKPARGFQRFPWQWFKFGVALAGAVMLTWNLTYFLLVPSQDDRFADEAISGHLRSLLIDHLTDITSSDPMTVRDWFKGKLNFAPPIKQLSKQDFVLVGGRLDYMYGREVAAASYRRGSTVINLFIWPAEDTRDTAPRRLSDDGFSILLWTEAGFNFCSIAKLDEKGLAEFANVYRDEAG
ncbi:MAG: zf-HC2 domain-containing protein [Candidatus Competibacter sp.]|nr:zf-HC2 domain-containing protein [Candidatus Competibacter sp.]